MLKLQRAWFGNASMPVEASERVEMYLDSHNRVHVRTDFDDIINVSIRLNAREVVPMSDVAYEHSYGALLDAEVGYVPPAATAATEPSVSLSDNEPTAIVKVPQKSKGRK